VRRDGGMEGGSGIAYGVDNEGALLVRHSFFDLEPNNRLLSL
jgi:hypothetical protein